MSTVKIPMPEELPSARALRDARRRRKKRSTAEQKKERCAVEKVRFRKRYQTDPEFRLRESIRKELWAHKKKYEALARRWRSREGSLDDAVEFSGVSRVEFILLVKEGVVPPSVLVGGQAVYSIDQLRHLTRGFHSFILHHTEPDLHALREYLAENWHKPYVEDDHGEGKGVEGESPQDIGVGRRSDGAPHRVRSGKRGAAPAADQALCR